MRRLMVATTVAVLGLTFGAGAALAEPAETFTVHYETTEIDDPGNPCAPLINAVAEVNGVIHETVNGNGGHFTITETGIAEGETPDGDPLVARYTFWAGFNFNAKTGAFHGVATVTAKGTVDGEPFKFNLRDRFTATGGVVTFNCHDGNGPQSVSY